MFTEIKTLDEYLNSIDKNNDIIAIWEQGSFLEGLSDEFSDRDFAVIWEKKIPTFDNRIEAANKLNFVIHEIKDVVSIGQSFDMFSDGKFLFNIGHGSKVKETKWYEALLGEKFPGDLDSVLMSVSALEKGKVYFQKNNWVDRLLEKVKLNTEIRMKIINFYSEKISKDLKLLQKSSSRGDFLQFIKYLYKILRGLQLVYLLREEKPVISEKFFESRFAKMENGEITRLVRNISTKMDMDCIYNDTLKLTSSFDIQQSEILKA